MKIKLNEELWKKWAKDNDADYQVDTDGTKVGIHNFHWAFLGACLVKDKEIEELKELVREGYAQWELNLIEGSKIHPSNTVYKHLFKRAEKYRNEALNE